MPSGHCSRAYRETHSPAFSEPVAALATAAAPLHGHERGPVAAPIDNGTDFLCGRQGEERGDGETRCPVAAAGELGE